MRRLLVTLIVWLVFAASVSAQDHPTRREASLLAAMIAAAGADLSTTAYCVGARTCHELNPALRWAEHRPFTLGTSKMLLTAVSVYGVHRLSHAHPKLAWVVGGALTAVWTTAAIRTRRIIREQP